MARPDSASAMQLLILSSVTLQRRPGSSSGPPHGIAFANPEVLLQECRAIQGRILPCSAVCTMWRTPWNGRAAITKSLPRISSMRRRRAIGGRACCLKRPRRRSRRRGRRPVRAPCGMRRRRRAPSDTLIRGLCSKPTTLSTSPSPATPSSRSMAPTAPFTRATAPFSSAPMANCKRAAAGIGARPRRADHRPARCGPNHHWH